MNRKIKLIWDFKGADAEGTAKHHCIHLKEFSELHNLDFHTIDSKKINDFFWIAYVVVNECDMKIFRDALKPHRGELA